ncbi:jerky protein homolog-like [Argiope bruennichi]|uniref:Jerky protein homolog-like like protein n=1 Tax=Argiope bruennichi TaxID=94029 RepID=A0A8T0EJB9_ARGBR|nr:jerky protein homolog-like [Argiope bruennichi]KAF8771724.1 Jerky protein homolog-like like protein [Argiope bruennichi]
MFLPPNVTALIQPMDQGVIATMKRTYRTKLLMTKIEGFDLKKFWKHYTILDSIYDIASAWDSVKPSTLIKSWRKLMPNVEAHNNLTPLSCEEENEDVDTPTATLADMMKTVLAGENVDAENINEWLECDVNEPGFGRLTDDEIVKKARGETENEGERSEDEEEPTVQMRQAHEAALQQVDGLLSYLEEQDGAELAEKLMLRKMQSRIKRKCFQSKKQTQITDFFRKV